MSKRITDEAKLEEINFVVSVVDNAYKPPRLTIRYAGKDLLKAERIYSKNVTMSERTNVHLDLVQGEVDRRLKEV